MTRDEDRLFVAAALVRQLVSEANVRHALEEKSGRHPSVTVSDILVDQGILSAKETEIFRRFLEERLGREPDRALAFESLLQRRIGEALAIVTAPAVRCFLRGETTELDSVELRSTSNFRLERLHNEGGLGQIWLAVEENTSREVAIKRIKPHVRLEDEPRRRFIQEARVIGLLQHPNIVPVYHLGITAEDREPYYAMPFIRGRTLEDVIHEYHESSRVGPSKAGALNRLLNIFLKVCDAVGYANSCGIIHRDLKPQNVMVGTFGEVFVLDWGLAKSLAADGTSQDNVPTRDEKSSDSGSATETQVGTVLGSPLYMAPEQAAGDAGTIDARTDVFGLGGILYKTLSGKEPHARDAGISLPDHLARIVADPVPSVARLGVKVPPALAAICDKALAIEPGERYASAGELREDIERWLVGSPVSVYREPLTRTVARWALRHRRLSSVAAAAVILLVISTSTVLASAWAYGNATLKHQVLALELHSTQVIRSIQGDVEWAFRDAESVTDRLRFADLIIHYGNNNADEVRKWTEIYRPIVEKFMHTENYYHAACLFATEDWTKPAFLFERFPDDQKKIVERLFEDPHRPIVIESLRQITQLKPGERWCSKLLVVHTPNDGPLPVLLGGFALFADGKAVGYLLVILDFRVPLEYLAANLHLSEGISITSEEGEPFFYFDLDEKRNIADAYRDIPPIPRRVAAFLESSDASELHLDYPDRQQRQLVCARKAPILRDRSVPFLGIALATDYDRLMLEPMEMRWWIAGVVTAVVLVLMAATWLVIRAITLIALG